MKCSTVLLGDLLFPAPIRRAGDADYPILSMTMRQGLVLQSEKFNKRIASRDTANYRVIKKGELVVGFPIDEAVLSIQRVADAGIVSPAYEVWRVNANRVDDRFLERYLRSNAAIAYYKANMRGTTARRKTLPDDKFKGMPVPLPDINEQRRIAAILDKAEAIRRKREQSLALADDLLKSAFMHRFGDPAINPKGLCAKPIKALGEVVTGNTPSRHSPENYGDGVEWIKSDNINTPSHFLTMAEERLSAIGERIARKVPAGSILVTCIAGSPDCIGNAAMTDREVAFNQQINAIVPNEKTDPHFLYAQVLAAKKLIQRASTNSMKGMVSKGRFQEIEFLAPNDDEQRAFGAAFKRMLSTFDVIQRQTEEATLLFATLSQRAFRGEL